MAGARTLRKPIRRGSNTGTPSNGSRPQSGDRDKDAISVEQPLTEIPTRGVAAGRSRPTLSFAVDRFPVLLQAIVDHGYEIIGPTVQDRAIVYDRITSVSDLPAGWTDEQAPGRYRLKRREDQALFGYAVGPHSWKRYLHPPEVMLWAAERHDGKFHILNNERKPQPRAFLGARACELAAIAVQDRVLLQDKYRHPIYGERRDNLFIVAVQCTQAAATCFCSSMGTGPQVQGNFDLLLTEFPEPKNHHFLVQAGSERGEQVLKALNAAPAVEEDVRTAAEAVDTVARQQVRQIETDGLNEFLDHNFENPQWEKIAARCLSCANCTLVCPTCFCTTVEDTTDLSGNHAERWRRWDSCFTLNFSYIHGGSIRASSKARYRQWMTHKLAAWVDQFGTFGCVGCGRCITWCPVGIDITEEVRAMRKGDGNGNS